MSSTKQTPSQPYSSSIQQLELYGTTSTPVVTEKSSGCGCSPGVGC
ncbi:MAG: hypothetical protein ACYC91_17490 [Solirubrobacteraceae bacterium]